MRDSNKNVHNILIKKPNGRRNTRRTDHKTKTDHKKSAGVCGVDSIGGIL
jgi:hypothetical protein